MADRQVSRHGPAAVTIPRAFIRWWRGNLPHLGLTRAAGVFLGEMWEFLREATPHRRKQRYGDMDFDWDYRVDTTSANVSRRADLLAALAGYRYQPSDPALFHESIRGRCLSSITIRCSSMCWRRMEFCAGSAAI